MAEKVQHPYACINKGCPNGYNSVFYGAPPEWFSEKGISQPKNCPDCREWRKSQSDSKHRCASCGFIILQRAGAKKAFHRHQGAYSVPTHCRKCLDGKKPPRTSVTLPDRRTRLQSQPRSSLNLVDYHELSAYRQEHYGKHIPGHPHSEVGLAIKDGRSVSRTSLVNGAASSVEMFFAGKAIAERTDGDVYQYTRPNGVVIKATIVDCTHVEKTIFRRRTDGRYEFVTSYDEIPIDVAKSWK